MTCHAKTKLHSTVFPYLLQKRFLGIECIQAGTSECRAELVYLHMKRKMLEVAGERYKH